jgi:hypothetical protein
MFPFIKKWFSSSACTPCVRRDRRATSFRPELEALEYRLVPATVGPAFNVTTAGHALHSVNASSPTGNWSVVVWTQDDGQGQPDIYAQVYDHNHQASGNAVRVASSGHGYVVDDPAVVMDQAGNFAVVWSATSATDYRINGRWLVSSGLTAPLIFTVSHSDHYLGTPTVSMDGGDNLKVAFASAQGIQVATLNPHAVVTSTFTVAMDGGQSASQPKIAETPAGWYAIAFVQDGRIRLDEFSANDADQGPQFLDTRSRWSLPLDSSPSLAMDQNGNCVVAWSVAAGYPQAVPSIVACRVNVSGVAGSVITIGQGILPSVALSLVGPDASAGGNFVVAYQQDASMWAQQTLGETGHAVMVTEVTSNDTMLSTVWSDLGTQPSISMGALGQYFISETTAAGNIRGQFGWLPQATSSGGGSGGVYDPGYHPVGSHPVGGHIVASHVPLQ